MLLTILGGLLSIGPIVARLQEWLSRKGETRKAWSPFRFLIRLVLFGSLSFLLSSRIPGDNIWFTETTWWKVVLAYAIALGMGSIGAQLMRAESEPGLKRLWDSGRLGRISVLATDVIYDGFMQSLFVIGLHSWHFALWFLPLASTVYVLAAISPSLAALSLRVFANEWAPYALAVLCLFGATAIQIFILAP